MTTRFYWGWCYANQCHHINQAHQTRNCLSSALILAIDYWNYWCWNSKEVDDPNDPEKGTIRIKEVVLIEFRVQRPKESWNKHSYPRCIEEWDEETSQEHFQLELRFIHINLKVLRVRWVQLTLRGGLAFIFGGIISLIKGQRAKRMPGGSFSLEIRVRVWLLEDGGVLFLGDRIVKNQGVIGFR